MLTAHAVILRARPSVLYVNHPKKQVCVRIAEMTQTTGSGPPLMVGVHAI